MAKEIFKVQIPIGSNEDEPVAIVYNEDRSKDFALEITDELLDLMYDEIGMPIFKQFFYGSDDGETFNLDDVAPWQEW